MHELLAILSLGILCGAWVVFQRWLARVDPDLAQQGSCCGGCSGHRCGTQPDVSPR